LGGADKGHGFSAVAAFPDDGFEGDLSEEGDLDAVAFLLRASLTEEVIAFAVVAFKVGHIFDEAEDGDVHFGKHGDGLASIDHGDFLGSGDDKGAIEGDGLDEGQLDVAGAGREVEDEDVELAPGDLLEELLGVAIGERATNDDGGIVTEEKSHRHEFESVGFDGNDAVLGVGVGLLVGDAEHEGNGRAIEVAIEKADLEALLGECDGEVAGDGGLAHAAFSGADGDDAFDSREGSGAGGGFAAGGWVLDVNFDADLAAIADEGVEDFVTVGEDLFGDLGVLGLDLELDVGFVLLKGGGFYETEGYDVAGKAGVFDF